MRPAFLQGTPIIGQGSEMKRVASPFALMGLAVLALAIGIAFVPAIPQAFSQSSSPQLLDPAAAAEELERATRESKRAKQRTQRLQAEAAQATEAADKTARETAALAAQVQQVEADITAAKARYSLAQSRRASISAQLAQRREPLLRLTSALQTTSRRPLALSALQPGSLKDVVYVRAVLNSAIPEIRSRTSDLRSALDRGRAAENAAANALAEVRENESALSVRRNELAALEQSQRLASRDARSNAVRENERALALAEEARDLDGLIDRLGKDAKLRRDLAALPGPKMRPANLAEMSGNSVDEAAGGEPIPSPASSSAPTPFQLPVQGRTLAGFGEARTSGLRSNGIALAPAPAAQIVAPALGRVVFAGPYRGYDRIIIIEHQTGWTSLVTGLGRIDVEVGQSVIAGSPIGIAGRRDPVVSLELRREGDLVNPLELIN